MYSPRFPVRSTLAALIVVGAVAFGSSTFAQEVGTLRGKPSKEQILQALSPAAGPATPAFRTRGLSISGDSGKPATPDAPAAAAPAVPASTPGAAIPESKEEVRQGAPPESKPKRAGSAPAPVIHDAIRAGKVLITRVELCEVWNDNSRPSFCTCTVEGAHIGRREVGRIVDSIESASAFEQVS